MMNIQKLFNTLIVMGLLSVSTYAELPAAAEAPTTEIATAKAPGIEMTLVILKPDCIEKKIVGDVISRFENYGLEIRGIKMMQLSEAILKEHYAHIVHKDFFPEVLAYMSSRPVIILALEGKNAIEEVRELIGSTDPNEAEMGTIRADYGDTKMRNVVHASDNVKNAQIEIKRFFNSNEVFE